MYSFLLKRALPFTLTFVFGAALGGLVGLFGPSEKKAESALGTRTYDYGRRCRAKPRRHQLVAESKPLNILYKPVVAYPAARGFEAADVASARVEVTFGSEGRVTQVRPLTLDFKGPDESDLVRVKAMWESVERAAQRIEFTPETLNGVPVTVTRVVEMDFAPAYR
ncbi:MAG TPA: hypothetical protein VN282_22685 [Pyrinomonadaceae bacterium]|nr:hypothetical protein [Pyrinomonadaceae bacterium]